MNRLSSPVMDGAEDSTILYSSTAPTTPEGSYMSSPLLQPQQQVPESLDMDITQTRTVRRICCVGAGYVGKSVIVVWRTFPARPNRVRRVELTDILFFRRWSHGSSDRLQQPTNPRNSRRPKQHAYSPLEQPASAHLRAGSGRHCAGGARRDQGDDGGSSLLLAR